MSKVHNPNCDSAWCTAESGAVRLLPTGGDSNAILCRACHYHELKWRKERNKDLGDFAKFKLPKWEELKVYII